MGMKTLNALQNAAFFIVGRCFAFLVVLNLPIITCRLRCIHTNPDRPQTVAYKDCGTTLESVMSQRDLGVIATNNLSLSLHYGKLYQKAYNALHLIKRSLPESAPVYLKKQLYISLVRSHLSYCPQIWKPRYVKDISCLERIQRRSTKYILNDYSTGYKSRLQTLFQ